MKRIGKILLVMFIGFTIGCGIAEAQAQYRHYQKEKQADIAISKFLKGLSDQYGFEYTETKKAK